MYKIIHFKDGCVVSTNAVDEISDSLEYYIVKDPDVITDDGYMFNEFEIMGYELSLDERKTICTRIAHFYFCEFDEDTEEIYKKINPETDLDNAVMSMIQASTAIATLINFWREK